MRQETAFLPHMVSNLGHADCGLAQDLYGKGDGAVSPLLHSRARAAHERLIKLKLGSMDRIMLGTSTRGLAKVRSRWQAALRELRVCAPPRASKRRPAL